MSVFEKLFKTVVFFLQFLATTFLFFCLAQTTFAQVEITEIMYSLEGPDDPYEWVEIYNNGSNEIDISEWRFNDGDNHKFVISEEKGGQGSLVLASFSYAIIADDANTFISKYSSFSGTVIDTVMSLNNTFDTLQIKDVAGVIVSEKLYYSSVGADGDGNSLQKVNSSWCAGVPTPGGVNINVCADSSDDDSPASGDDGDTQEQEPPATYSDTMSSWAEESKISAYAGVRKRVVVAGASTQFMGQSRAADGEPLQFARYIWSFGDGAREEGKDITHTYYYPGEYVVVLNTASGGYAAMDRVSVEVISADIAISNVSFDDPSFIEIYNKTSYELDLSQWKLKVGKQKFTISQDTFIKPKKKIIFPAQVTKLSIKKGDEISFLYPSGDIVTSHSAKEDLPTPTNKTSNNTQTAQPASDYVEEKVVVKNTANQKEEEKLAVAGSFGGVAKSAVARSYGEVKEELITPNTAQAANVLSEARSQKENKDDGLFWGIMGVSLVSLIAIYGVLISKERENPVQSGDEIGLYKIIEIED